MLQQIRRAIGVDIVSGHVKQKLGRLHHVRETAEEAARTCKTHYSNNRWKPSQKGRTYWFREHTQKATQPMNNSEMDINTACLESMSVIMIGNEVWVYKIIVHIIKSLTHIECKPLLQSPMLGLELQHLLCDFLNISYNLDGDRCGHMKQS